MKAHKEAEELPWPPTAEEIACRSDEQVPIDLKRFLNLVLSGNEKETSEKNSTPCGINWTRCLPGCIKW